MRVGESGAFELRSGDRVLLATSGRAAPTARTSVETFRGPAAIWIFERSGERRFVLDQAADARLEDDRVIVELASSDGTASGRLVVAPGATAETTRLSLTMQGVADLGSLALPVRCDPDGTFHGFGEQYDATDQRGHAFPLFVTEQGIGRTPGEVEPRVFVTGTQHTTYFPMPYYLDARGFGVLLHTPRRVEVDLCASDPEVAWLEVVGREPLEATVFDGPTPLDVIRQLGDEVGRPTPLPAWAYELWIASQGGREAVLGEVDALEAAGIPARVLWVQDWTGIRRNIDPKLPDHFADIARAELLIRRADGTTYVHFAPSIEVSHPDLTNPAARDYVKNAFRTMVRDYGMHGFMADFGEWLPLDAHFADGSNPLALHNVYPILWHSLWREAMDKLRPDGDFAVFARSGFTGVHAVSQIHWVGDQECNFGPYDGLPTVVPAMLNLGLAGIPFVTHDIAGFSGGPSTKELFRHWTELSAFTPIMRTHEGGNKLENWSWEKGAETTAHFRRFARIHQALIPEIRRLADEAARTSAPIVRHLMLVFPDDPQSRSVSDQFLLGDALLVAPVVEQGAVTRRVYLPPGRWYDVWSGTPYESGTTVEVAAPIGRPPMFSRDADRADLRAIE